MISKAHRAGVSISGEGPNALCPVCRKTFRLAVGQKIIPNHSFPPKVLPISLFAVWPQCAGVGKPALPLAAKVGVA